MLLCFPCCPATVRNGHIKRITDQDIQSSVLEIMSSNVNTTFITCPADPAQTLGIKLPFLVMIIKNLKKYFSFEVTVLDDKGVKRRFRASNYQVRKWFCMLCWCRLLQSQTFAGALYIRNSSRVNLMFPLQTRF